LSCVTRGAAKLVTRRDGGGDGRPAPKAEGTSTANIRSWRSAVPQKLRGRQCCLISGEVRGEVYMTKRGVFSRSNERQKAAG